MPKVKTHKGTAKRFKKTGSGKITHRTSGQDHFNSRESGKVGVNKRSDSNLSANNARIKKAIPHI
ncbi:MAG: 50S ribosomal protein L35 [Candidatus Doudnabacteria bacterium]